MPYAIRVHETGGPDALKWEELPAEKPGKGEVLIRHTAIGLNYIDVYFRTGLYKAPLPFIPGQEGAGVVLAVGRGVTGLKPGDRVAYTNVSTGGYSEQRVVPADKLIKLPAGIADVTAAAMMLKGLTAQFLVRRAHKVAKGETILVHAAAGGVGMIVCQWASHLGATVIGTVGSKEKAKIARAHGCTHPIVYTEEDFVERVAKITKGRKVPVVYDSVGKDTFEGSLNCLQPRGLFVTYGNSSGPIPPFAPLVLTQKGSLFMTRPALPAYIGTRAEYEAAARDLFKVVKSGAVKIEVNQTFPLKDAAAAHRALESRKTTGSTVLIP
ncbi:MAG: quinone oxidoreductase [Rhodospirillaceae bacterium]